MIEDFVKTDSGLVENTDVEAYNQYILQRSARDKTDHRIKELESHISSIELMLKQILEKVN